MTFISLSQLHLSCVSFALLWFYSLQPFALLSAHINHLMFFSWVSLRSLFLLTSSQIPDCSFTFSPFVNSTVSQCSIHTEIMGLFVVIAQPVYDWVYCVNACCSSLLLLFLGEQRLYNKIPEEPKLCCLFVCCYTATRLSTSWDLFALDWHAPRRFYEFPYTSDSRTRSHYESPDKRFTFLRNTLSISNCRERGSRDDLTVNLPLA